MASNLYHEGLRRIIDRAMSGNIDLLADTIKVLLIGTAYTPDKDHQFISDVSGSELSGTGYTGGFGGSGRKALASKAIGKSDASDKAYFDAADLTWTAINAGTVGYLVLAKEITNDGASPIICCIDVSPDVATNGGDYTVQWHADGIFTLSS